MAKKTYRACLRPFVGQWSSGPFVSKQDDRLKITLHGGESGKVTMSYARYLYAASTGESIPPGYEIDHVDGNKKNDSISNLVALTKEEHRVKTLNDPTRLAMKKTLTTVCIHCEEVFTIPFNRSFIARGNHASYCSRECSKHAKKYLGISPEIIKRERVKDVLPRVFEPWEAWSKEITEEVKESLDIKKGSILNSLTLVRKVCVHCAQEYTPTHKEQKYCSPACSNRRDGRRTKVDENALEGVLKRVHKKELSYAAAGRMLGVSDNAVRKRYKKFVNGF